MSTPTPVTTFACPRCTYAVNKATGAYADNVSPKPGDISICLACGAPLQLAADLLPRWLTFNEVEALPGKIRGQLAMAIVAAVTARHDRLFVRFTRERAAS